MATPIEPCSLPSSLSAVPAWRATSTNVPLPLFLYRKFGPASLATKRSGRPSPSKSLQTTPMPKRPSWIGDASLHRNVLERAISLVAIQRIAGAAQPSRAALNRNAVELAELALAELGQGVEPHVDVVGHEQVEPAVAVVVGERRAGRPSRIPNARLLRDIRKRAVAVVAIQPVRAVAGDVQVLPAVVVEVGGDDTHAPTRIAHTCLVRGVDERAVAPVTPQLAARAPRVARGRDRGRVDEVHVEQAVLVEVEEGDASAHGFEDVLLVGRRDVRESDPALFRDVGERHVLEGASGHNRQIRGDGGRDARRSRAISRSFRQT